MKCQLNYIILYTCSFFFYLGMSDITTPNSSDCFVFTSNVYCIIYQRDSTGTECFEVTINDDDLSEPSESLNITLSENTIEFLEDSGYSVTLSHTILTIKEDSSDCK